MTFRTTLFRALVAADVALCNGQRVRSKLLDTASLLTPYVDLDDGSTVRLRDDEIEIDDDGRAYSRREGSPEAIVWHFQCLRPMTASCVETLVPPAPTVEDVVVRAKRRLAQSRR
jgi:hypothetical protein